MKKLIIIINIILMLFISADTISAGYSVACESATLSSPYSDNIEERSIILKNFLSKYNSPLSQYSYYFVKYSDDFGIDWRLVAAISGVESTFGKNIPFNSYNAYGWANGAKSFSSWEESIYIVSKALSENYIAKGATSVDKIGKIYAPPSKTWSIKVKYFMNKIQPTFLDFTI